MGISLLVWFLFFVIVVYNGVDVYQTGLLMGLGVYEGNPLLLLVMPYADSLWAIVVVKVNTLLIMATFLYLYLRKVKNG